jgi:uncharacterized protein YdbL (DUF1318 family)
MARMTMLFPPLSLPPWPAAGGCRRPLAQRGRPAPPRAAGGVGEMDGYLGYVTPSAGAQAVVDDINLKRRALYSDKARPRRRRSRNMRSSGCLLIAQTRPGEKYQAPNGSWQTRTAAAPARFALPLKRLFRQGLEPCVAGLVQTYARKRGKFGAAVDLRKPPPKGQAPSAGCRCA